MLSQSNVFCFEQQMRTLTLFLRDFKSMPSNWGANLLTLVGCVALRAKTRKIRVLRGAFWSFLKVIIRIASEQPSKALWPLEYFRNAQKVMIPVSSEDLKIMAGISFYGSNCLMRTSFVFENRSSKCPNRSTNTFVWPETFHRLLSWKDFSIEVLNFAHSVSHCLTLAQPWIRPPAPQNSDQVSLVWSSATHPTRSG